MNDPAGKPPGSRLWVILVALLIVLLAIWYLNPFGTPDDMERVIVTDVEDRSGGELIVTEPQEDAVEVQLPETPMTNVPPPQPTVPEVE